MGVPGRRSRGVSRPGLPVLAAAGSAVLVAACGSQAATTSSATQPASTASPAGATGPGSTGTPGGAALCSDQAAVTRLVVSRVSALPQNHLHFAFPAAITVASPGRARAVAAAVCGLPPMPRVVMNCPADLGVSYRLSFAAGSTTFPVVTASAGGCSGVAGAGPVRSTDRSPGFWAALARAMGISPAAALRGTSPGTPHTSPLRPGPTPAG
jgi:hypothetical protein